MAASTYTLHRRARTAFSQLPEDEQHDVQERLNALFEIPVEQWPAVWATRLPGDPPLYLVRLTDSQRAFIEVGGGRPPEVVDVVRHETLEAFAKAAAKNGSGFVGEGEAGRTLHGGAQVIHRNSCRRHDNG